MAKIQQLKFLKKTSYFKISKEEFNNLLGNHVIKKCVQLIFFMLALNFIIIALLWSKIPPQVPLYYSRPRGYDQLANKLFLPLIPVFCLFIVLVNLRISSFLFRKQLLLSQILVWSSFVISIIVSIAVIKILIITI